MGNHIIQMQLLCGHHSDPCVQPVFIPAVWKLLVPPRVHFFLWLLSKNKILTRDNVEKKERRLIATLACSVTSTKGAPLRAWGGVT